MVGYLFLTLILAAIDRAMKVFMSALLLDGRVVRLIPGVLQLRYTENTGAAFGIFANGTQVLSIVTSILVIVLLYVIVSKRIKEKLGNFALVFITAGGIGNLYDRIVNGFVVDYFEFTFVNYAIFNFADAMINVGAALLILFYIILESKARKTGKNTDPDEKQTVSEDIPDDNAIEKIDVDIHEKTGAIQNFSDINDE